MSSTAAEIFAICPLDGRYKSRVKDLSTYFSEFSLMKYRTRVEVEYFLKLSETIPQLAHFPADKHESLRDIYRNFGEADAFKIKEIESVTNHDVKAIEYFIKEKYEAMGLPTDCMEFIHFGLTSQDINNTAVPLSIKDCMNEYYLPLLTEARDALMKCAEEWEKYPMLARTHGQPATPTRLGKEIMVFVERINRQLDSLTQYKHTGKFGGASGSLNAHFVAFPEINWREFANSFCENNLGFTRQQNTTQIEHYDGLAEVFQTMSRVNTIFIDFCRDMWQYVSMTYFTQSVVKNEVGSSAMPHKVNPIDFENAEGNFGIANALFLHLASKLPISRLQRDLSDSTVIRAIGMPVGHSCLAFKSMMKGLSKMNVNEKSLEKDLEDNWAVVAEAIQTVLRREGFPKPYEALKALTRTGTKITKDQIAVFVQSLAVSDKVKEELTKISPQNFTGIPMQK
eukprot:m.23798 g.23798  ORF g.23798 m.23798 type:complete len:454 (+) comp14361_c1_seq1:55-1416(+)